jgi:hypothetical protein
MGTSAEPYTRVTTAPAKYSAARRIKEGGTDAPPQTKSFKLGTRV